MHQPFGQLPRPNPAVASVIAAAAAHVEQSLEQNEQEPTPDTDYPQIPPSSDGDLAAGDILEVVDEGDFLPLDEGGWQDGDSYECVSGGVVDDGSEYLAFYKSFRYVSRPPAVGRWGIFFVKRRCVALAKDMYFTTGHPFTDCLDGLTAFLYAHELYHYRFDAHCLQMEGSGGVPVYRPYRRFIKGQPVSEWHEESIANFYGLRALQAQKFNYAQSITDFLWDLVACSPGAYAGGIEKKREQSRRKDQMSLQAAQRVARPGVLPWNDLMYSTIRVGTNMNRTRESSLGALMHLDHCPVYWIDFVRGGKSVMAPYVASVDEVNNGFIKRYLGGVLDHHSDHRYYRIDNGEKVKLPNPHRPDLTNPEFHNILAKAGMTSTQFYKERQRTSVWRKGVPRNPPLDPRVLPQGGQ